MTVQSRLKDSLGIVVGAIGLLVAFLVLAHEHNKVDSVERLASVHKRMALVEGMQLALATASEAEKSAVMAITDEESQAFAGQARAASTAVDQKRQEFAALVQAGGNRDEIDLLSQFSQAFAEYQHIEHEVLDLAVKNTNLKAFSLACGPAMESMHEMDAALVSLLEKSSRGTEPDARRALLLAARAERGALWIQAYFGPHITEASDEKMDALEATMDKEDKEVRKNLEELSRLVPADASNDLQQAAAAYAKFTGLETQILVLSRQNTNVRSLTISLNEKRLAVAKCQDLLLALEQAIRNESGSTEAPVNPRKM